MADSSSNVDQVIAGAGADQKVNENFDPASPAMLYGRRASTCTGLVFGYYGGRYGGTLIANGTVTATASVSNYVVADVTTGAVSISTSITNWNNTGSYLRLYLLSAGTTTIVSYQDFRQSIGASGGGGGGMSNPMTTAGDIIKGGASGAPGRLGIGTAGQVLTVVSGAPAWAAAGGGGATLTGVETLTNKRVTPRVGSTASSATPTINTDSFDVYRLTAQTAAITSFSTNLTGTPTHGDALLIEITGTAARAIAWGAAFEPSTVALPATTVSTDMLSVAFTWNSATSKWRCVGVA